MGVSATIELCGLKVMGDRKVVIEPSSRQSSSFILPSVSIPKTTTEELAKVQEYLPKLNTVLGASDLLELRANAQ